MYGIEKKSTYYRLRSILFNHVAVENEYHSDHPSMPSSALRPPSTRAITTVLCVFGLLYASLVSAAPRATKDLPEPYRIPTENPASIEEIYDVVGKSSSNASKGEILKDLSERAVCGGWMMDETVNGKIPTVTGVPGRRGDPFGNLLSGMAKREEDTGARQDGFLFPKKSEVRGWSTECHAGFPPYLDDAPPCKEDPNKGPSTPKQCQALCPRINRWQYPIWAVAWRMLESDAAGNVFLDDDGKPTVLDSEFCIQQGKNEETLNRAPKEGDCCERMGKGGDAPNCQATYGSDKEDPNYDPGIPDDAKCLEIPTIPPPPGKSGVWEQINMDDPTLSGTNDTADWLGWYYCCTGAVVTKFDYEACKIDTPDVCVAHPDAFRNCVRCEGDGFPAPATPDKDFNKEKIARGPDRKEMGCRLGQHNFVSYFREYTMAGYSRDAVSVVANDVTSRNGIPVACYGFYDEFDPKTRATVAADARCVIGAYTAANEFRTFYQTQRGHGDYGQERTYPDPDPTTTRELRSPSFDENADLWFQNLGGGFSLINGKVFTEKYGKDMTFALLSLDTALERARGPLLSSSAASSASSGHGEDWYRSFRTKGALRRAFDDTVTNATGDQRRFTEWWQGQEMETHELTSPAIARIIFPSGWSTNLHVNHFFPSPNLSSPRSSAASSGSYDPRRGTIELQTELHEDLLGEVAAFLEQALVAPIEQKEIPFVVPMGSATDFRADKEGWIRWKNIQILGGKTVPSEVDTLIDRLEEYAVQIDRARELRRHLAESLSSTLERQGTLQKHIHDWLSGAQSSFQSFQQQRQTREQLLYKWQEIQEAYRKFHDITNMPWCKNDTFTTPVYSFLDPWLPGRNPLNGNALPSLSIEKPKDVLVDLTALEGSNGTIQIPVLRPTQILLDRKVLNPPGALQGAPSPIPTLPPLPPLPDFQSAASTMPLYDTASGIIITFPDVSIPGDAQFTLAHMHTVINGMNGAYGKFWNAITKPRCGTLEAQKRCEGQNPADGDCCVRAGEEEFCRKGWDKDTCVHVEMDLLERFTRMGARPAVLLKNDFDVIGSWRTRGAGTRDTFPVCNTNDWSCLDLHREEQQPKFGWYTRVQRSQQNASTDALRSRLYLETLRNTLSSSSHFPYQGDPSTITPSFEQRPPIDLSTKAPRSGSAGSTSS